MATADMSAAALCGGPGAALHDEPMPPRDEATRHGRARATMHHETMPPHEELTRQGRAVATIHDGAARCGRAGAVAHLTAVAPAGRIV